MRMHTHTLIQSKDNDVHDDDGWSKRHCCVELPALHWSTIIPVCRIKRESKQRLCDNNFKWRSNAQTHFYFWNERKKEKWNKKQFVIVICHFEIVC